MEPGQKEEMEQEKAAHLSGAAPGAAGLVGPRLLATTSRGPVWDTRVVFQPDLDSKLQVTIQPGVRGVNRKLAASAEPPPSPP